MNRAAYNIVKEKPEAAFDRVQLRKDAEKEVRKTFKFKRGASRSAATPRKPVLSKSEREREVVVKKAKLEEKTKELKRKISENNEAASGATTYTGAAKAMEEIKKVKEEKEVLENS